MSAVVNGDGCTDMLGRGQVMRRPIAVVLALAACGAAAVAGTGRQGVFVSLYGPVDAFLVEQATSRLRTAAARLESRKGADPGLVILDLHTTNGSAAMALSLADAIYRLRDKGVETVALVQAPGSAATTALALPCDHLFMASASRLMAIDPAAFQPPATDAERGQLLQAARRYSAARPRLKALYEAFVTPDTEVFATVEEGREGQAAFLPADEFRRQMAEKPESIVRSERVAEKRKRADLAAADAVRLGLAGGLVNSPEAAAIKLLVTADNLSPLLLVGKAPTTAAGEVTPKKARLGPVGDGNIVVVIPLTGMVGHGMLASIERRLAEAKKLDPALVIFELDTPGGRLDSAYEISDKIFDIKTPRTVAYVNDEAISAGAFIAVACDEIVMQAGSTMGDCQIVSGGEPVRLEKYESPLRARWRNFCEGKYPIALAMAMVTEDIEVYECVTADGTKEYLTDKEFSNLTAAERDRFVRTRKVVTKEELLTLTDTDAKEYGFAKAVVESRKDILEVYGIADREIEFRVLDWNWSERAVRYLDWVAPVLLMLGVLGIVIELKTPGFGVFGFAGLALLSIFFFGKHAAGLAEVWEIALFVVGVGLLAVELFVTPGFGIMGVAGILCMVASLLLSLQSFVWPETSWEWSEFERNLAVLGFVMTGTFIGLVVVARYLHKAPYIGRLVLAAPAPSTSPTALTESVSPAPSAASEQRREQALVGRRGTAVSMLRPAGRAEFDGEPLDVVTEGDFIHPGEPIEICRVRGNRIVVKRVT